MNNIYNRLHTGFTEWLRILNFEPTSQRDMPKMLTEFLDYMERKGCVHIHQISDTHLKNYLDHLHERPNHKWGGGLSKNYIRKQMQVIKKFSRYLTESGQASFTVKLRIKGKSSNIKSILSIAEIELLYQATKEDNFGLRDRAILALYYGCGLRKNEGVNVNIKDILLDKDLIFIRKGKGHKERYVPISATNKTDLENYIHYARPHLMNDNNRKEEALLISIKGKRLAGATIFERIQKLRVEARLTKVIGLHTCATA